MKLGGLRFRGQPSIAQSNVNQKRNVHSSDAHISHTKSQFEIKICFDIKQQCLQCVTRDRL